MRNPDTAHIARLQAREAARFAEARPRSAALLARAALDGARRAHGLGESKQAIVPITSA
jgi:hypothetical protein